MENSSSWIYNKKLTIKYNKCRIRPGPALTGLENGDVREHVVDAALHVEGHRAVGRDAARAQMQRHRVGDGVQLAVRQADALRADDRRPVGRQRRLPPERLVQQALLLVQLHLVAERRTRRDRDAGTGGGGG